MRSKCPKVTLAFALVLSGCGGKEGGKGAPQASNEAPKTTADEAADDDSGASSTTVVSAPLELAPAADPKTSPFVEPPSEAETSARAVMDGVVREHALDPDNAWAVAHALIVYGPEAKLDDGKLAVDAMFERWATKVEREGRELASFPGMKGKIPVEPHPGLMLKSIAEAGVDPTHEITTSDGAKVPVSTLFRGAAEQLFVDEAGNLPLKWNDTPWLVQGVATWAPADFAWTAEGGHETDLDAVTHALVAQLRKETDFLHEAMAQGSTVQKRKQGIFSYTCGGQHLIQGAAYAVARGFGAPEDRATMTAEVDALLFRTDVELNAVDALIPQLPEYRGKLLAQRLKYLGHTLETVHKMAALGLVELDEDKKTALRKVREEITNTVQMIQTAGLFDELEAIKGRDYQLYLDLVGDSAHALRGLSLADGTGAIRI